MKRHGSFSSAPKLLLLACLGSLTYLPALDNFFVNDDFWWLATIRRLERDFTEIFSLPTEYLRLTSHVGFLICYKLFGLQAAWYHLVNILLHVANCILVFVLISRLSGSQLAGLVAGLFFAAYDGHHEAVMWISAVNALWLTLFFLITLIFWERFLSSRCKRWYRLALGSFALALSSKEPSVMLLPMMMLLELLFFTPCEGYLAPDLKLKVSNLIARRGLRNFVARYLPFMVLVSAYLAHWFSTRSQNYFLQNHYYEFSFRAALVYLNSLHRLLFPSGYLVALTCIYVCFREGQNLISHRERPIALFLASWILLSIAPYIFISYLNYIPSRNTYLPSVGSSALVGVLIARSCQASTESPKNKSALILALVLILASNIAYVWFKRDPQWVKNGALTKALIEALKSEPTASSTNRAICIHGYPFQERFRKHQEMVARAAVELFARIPPDRIVFVNSDGGISDSHLVLSWNPTTSSFERLDQRAESER